MSSLDVCATVGCNHRRDEHERRAGECFLCMDCRRFTELYAHAGHELVELPGDPTFCATCGHDVMGPSECRTGSEPPTAAEPTFCHQEVLDGDGMLDACNAPATTVRPDPEGAYPVCAAHALPTVAEHDDNLAAILSEHATIALFIGPDDRHHCVCGEPFGPEIIRMMPPTETVEGWHREHVVQVIRAVLLSALDGERAKNFEALALLVAEIDKMRPANEMSDWTQYARDLNGWCDEIERRTTRVLGGKD